MVEEIVIDESWYQRPPGVPEAVSAGGIVVRLQDGIIYVALVQEAKRPQYVQYVLPKGHLETGESIEEAARREIAEEAGINQLKLITFLETKERLSFLKKSWKIIHYFLFTTEQIEGKPTDPHIDYQLQWFPLEELPAIFWPEQKALIETNRASIRQALLS